MATVFWKTWQRNIVVSLLDRLVTGRWVLLCTNRRSTRHKLIDAQEENDVATIERWSRWERNAAPSTSWAPSARQDEICSIGHQYVPLDYMAGDWTPSLSRETAAAGQLSQFSSPQCQLRPAFLPIAHHLPSAIRRRTSTPRVKTKIACGIESLAMLYRRPATSEIRLDSSPVWTLGPRMDTQSSTWRLRFRWVMRSCPLQNEAILQIVRMPSSWHRRPTVYPSSSCPFSLDWLTPSLMSIVQSGVNLGLCMGRCPGRRGIGYDWWSLPPNRILAEL